MFGLLIFVAYQGFSFSSIDTFLITVLCFLATFSIFNRYQNNALKLLKGTSKSLYLEVSLLD
jgi:hypothetical protein